MWEDNRNGYRDIYAYTIRKHITVHFSECNSTQGSCIVDPAAASYDAGSSIYPEVVPKEVFVIDKVGINGTEQPLSVREYWARSFIFTENTDVKAFFRKNPSTPREKN